MKESAYKKAGVDIDAADELIERIKPLAAKTARAGVMAGLGGFGALFDLKTTGLTDPILVSSTDGVGTKIKIAIDMNRHDTIGIDCVAMCVNDLVVQGAEPLFFLDYFATGKLENNVAESVISGVAKGCAEAGCALIGGETAEMPGLYADGDYDLAGFTVGAVNRDQLIFGDKVSNGDILLGLSSSGLHSNGYSLIRRLVETTPGINYESPAPYNATMSLFESLLIPTRIYVRPVLQALKIKDSMGAPAIRGMAHITGGGITGNVPRFVPEGLSAHIDAAAWSLPPVFRYFKEIGKIDDLDFATTLNCGLGMVLAVAKDKADVVESALKEAGETVYAIGEIKVRAGDDGAVLHNMAKAWR